MRTMRNKVQLIGNLGQNPEVREMKNGKMARFSIATTEFYKRQDGESVRDTHWHNVVAWGKLAEVVAAKMAKGTEVALEGNLLSRSYEDKDGNKKYITEIRMNDFLVIKAGKVE